MGIKDSIMIQKLLEEIESLIGTDYFVYDMEEKMDEIEQNGAGFEIITKLFQIMERHPLYDFGAPGAMVHFIEKFFPEYIPELIESLNRKPTLHTVWMLNRCINGVQDKDNYINLLNNISNNDNIEEEIRNSAKDFADYQKNK